MFVVQRTQVLPKNMNLAESDYALMDVQAAIEEVSSEQILAWQMKFGREKDRSVSKCINALIGQSLRRHGWETNWSYCPEVNSTHALFQFSKEFDLNQPKRISLELASRHSNEALGYLVKGQLGARSKPSNKFHLDGHVLLCFTEDLLAWGRWDNAVYSYEKYVELLPVLDGLVITPIWLFGLGRPKGIDVETTLAGSLRLSVSQGSTSF